MKFPVPRGLRLEGAEALPLPQPGCGGHRAPLFRAHFLPLVLRSSVWSEFSSLLFPELSIVGKEAPFQAVLNSTTIIVIWSWFLYFLEKSALFF